MWKGSRKDRVPVLNKAGLSRLVVLTKDKRARSKLSNSKVANRRTKIRCLRTALVLVIVVALGGGLSWISFLDILAVQRIVVEGNETVSTRAIQSKMMILTAQPALFLFSKQNTILYPSVELEDILSFEFSKIKTISIQRQPTQQQVSVSIVEREPYALWCRGVEEKRTCYLIDENGFIFQGVESEIQQAGNAIIFEGGIEESRVNVLRSSVDSTYFSQVEVFLKELELLDLQPTKFVFEGNDARVTLDPNWELRVALDKDLGATAFNLEAILEEHNLRGQLETIRYIDMRFDERVYYTVRESTDSTE